MSAVSEIRKAMAFTLSAAIVLGRVVMPGAAGEAYAATGTIRPSVTAYATKQQLMTEFSPNEDGTADRIVKIQFGKRETSESDTSIKNLEWYILGKDEDVDGDNITIFATNPIIYNQAFQSNYDEITYDSGSHGTYPEGDSVKTLAPNHYGASKLRECLRSLAENANFFSDEEQNLMQIVEVKTLDYKNGTSEELLEYTTKDKLYALQKEKSPYAYNIYAGSNNSKKIDPLTYWKGTKSWLRSPTLGSDNTMAYLGSSDGATESNGISAARSVRPAANVNLSSALFASSVPIPEQSTIDCGTISKSMPMRLRLKSEDIEIGTVSCAETEITATNETGGENIRLIVQGKNGNIDWYYSKNISGTETVSVDDIKEKLGSSVVGAVLLSSCKIWIEKSVDPSGDIAYAVEATYSYDRTENTSTISSVSTYATKEELMTEFTPGDDGTSENIAKILFGKKEPSGSYDETNNALEWYVLGKDTGLGEDNIAIFAANPMIRYYAYQSNPDNISYDSSKHGTYADGTNIETLYPNHYGASELREKLQELADDTDFFSSSEQNLLQATKISSWDGKNNVGYSVTDKLYAPACSGDESRKLRVGSNGSKKIAVNPYWWQGNDRDGQFWIHLFNAFGRSDALFIAGVGQGIYGAGTWFEVGVRPATNINIASVLFASAANTTASSEEGASLIVPSTAMALRVDGKDKNIGSVTYTAKSIGVRSIAEDGKAKLVVQGKNGDSDWYYSKPISGTDVVTVSDIESALGTLVTGDIDLSNCKIWLEVSSEDGGELISAVMATLHTHVYDENLYKSDAERHYHECALDICPDKEGSRQHIEAHTFTQETADDAYIATPSTCTKKATYHKICTVCGAVSTKDVDTFEYGEVAGHDYSNGWTRLDSGHSKICSRCAYIAETSKHEYDDDADMVCNICGYDRGHKHQLEYVEQTEPDCSTGAKGYQGHYECTDENCDLKFMDALGIFKVSDADLEIMPKHSMEKVSSIEATCTQDGSREYYECKNCGKKFADKTGNGMELKEEDIVVEKRSHDLQMVTTGNARYYKCRICDGLFDESGNELTSIPTTTHTETSSHQKHNSSGSGSSSTGGPIFSRATSYSTGGPGASSAMASTQANPAKGTAPLAQAGSWKKDTKGWRYNFTNGGYAVGTQLKDSTGNITERLNWLQINSLDYAFGADGYMKIGWVRDNADGKWYFCDENKGKIGGWYQSSTDKKWYYLNPVTGAMMTGWQLINGKQYYFATVYTSASGANAVAYPEGAMYAGTRTPDGYMVDASGAKIN